MHPEGTAALKQAGPVAHFAFYFHIDSEPAAER
jgi:hypothetical protein